jgi:hypothetical protein
MIGGALQGDGLAIRKGAAVTSATWDAP